MADDEEGDQFEDVRNGFDGIEDSDSGSSDRDSAGVFLSNCSCILTVVINPSLLRSAVCDRVHVLTFLIHLTIQLGSRDLNVNGLTILVFSSSI